MRFRGKALRPCCLQPLRLVGTPPLTPSSAHAQRGSGPGCGSLTVTVMGGMTVGGGLGAAGGGLAGGGMTVTGTGAAPEVEAGALGSHCTQAAPLMEEAVARAHLVPPTV